MSAEAPSIHIHFINVRVPSEKEQPLISFFQPVAEPQISHEAHATKTEFGLIEIVLTIIGTWAAERYVLDPLADRVEEWWSSVTSLKDTQFRVRLQFNEAGNRFNLDLVQTSNLFVLKSLWQYYRQVLGICASIFPGDLPIDRIELMPRNGNIIAIGYSGSRPTHYFNLEENSLNEIPHIRTAPAKKQEDGVGLEGQLFILRELEERLEYLQRLKSRGFPVSEDEINHQESEINEKWSLLLSQEA